MDDAERIALQKDRIKSFQEFAERHTYHLNGLITEAATEGLKFLGLMCLGGVAAALGFIGATKANSLWLVGALASFMLAEFATALAYFFRYVIFNRQLIMFEQAIAKGWAGSSPEDMGAAIDQWNREIREGRDWSLWCVVCALALFAVGMIGGTLGVLKYACS
ncbi:hypothetical protein [Paraburkholderia bannensis]|uniref:hypothetical protein n=1 Tax=Paraburkholderia bannensis TaxID=765414 RepID=UPI002AB7A926|nr:hypothetical protein [Paraburkholderia bannensis]